MPAYAHYRRSSRYKARLRNLTTKSSRPTLSLSLSLFLSRRRVYTHIHACTHTRACAADCKSRQISAFDWRERVCLKVAPCIESSRLCARERAFHFELTFSPYTFFGADFFPFFQKNESESEEDRDIEGGVGISRNERGFGCFFFYYLPCDGAENRYTG